MNVEIGVEAALFPEKEYINGIFVAVYYAYEMFGYPHLPLWMYSTPLPVLDAPLQRTGPLKSRLLSTGRRND
jgi:hypothetical protein